MKIALEILAALVLVAIIVKLWSRFFNRPWGVGFYRRFRFKEEDMMDTVFDDDKFRELQGKPPRGGPPRGK